MRNHALLGRQAGVGLIEILITLFILAIGLLGVASLQFVGSFANKDAISRTQSEFVAEQVAERLRAASRPAQAGDGLVVNNRYFEAANYNFSSLSCNSGSSPYQCYCLSRPADIPDCESGQCDEAQMAKYDGWALSCSAVQTNPATILSVACNDNNGADADNCSAGSRIEILLRWPVSTTVNRQYTLHERCNPDSDTANACVFKDITL
ncbi:pilus assembly protein PilV [Alteromonas pelagimontana]|uniref:Pilus assembly protein PilV n=1 Tax=Alteromonas pelagimontana TaxID=1858656 RepID=A0A6N3IYT2_9ALTE|nr:prepilin-type N-terminal cleavage/methylation domain-containing protein [Alteromonas pelagimontana]QJR82904.1 pilus assembly protein PilV [Alteromonas pelagimontana]